MNQSILITENHQRNYFPSRSTKKIHELTSQIKQCDTEFIKLVNPVIDDYNEYCLFLEKLPTQDEMVILSDEQGDTYDQKCAHYQDVIKKALKIRINQISVYIQICSVYKHLDKNPVKTNEKILLLQKKKSDLSDLLWSVEREQFDLNFFNEFLIYHQEWYDETILL